MDTVVIFIAVASVVANAGLTVRNYFLIAKIEDINGRIDAAMQQWMMARDTMQRIAESTPQTASQIGSVGTPAVA